MNPPPLSTTQATTNAFIHGETIPVFVTHNAFIRDEIVPVFATYKDRSQTTENIAKAAKLAMYKLNSTNGFIHQQ